MSYVWKLPAPGDTVWCLFPEIADIQPGPKPRPALVMRIECRTDGDVVGVAYATSKHLDRIETGEIAITKSKHPAAYVSHPGRSYGRLWNSCGWDWCHSFMACSGVLLLSADWGSWWLYKAT